jgi:hypothetical protein
VLICVVTYIYVCVFVLQGLTEDVTINKFFDEEMLFELAKQDAGAAEYAM